MNAAWQHFTAFINTPSGVVLCVAAVAIAAGATYDCVLQRRIRKLPRRKQADEL